MQDAIQVLALIETRQVEIDKVLAAKRPFSPSNFQQQQTTFAAIKQAADVQQAIHPEAEREMVNAANDLLTLLLSDETITEVLTRPTGHATESSGQLITNRYLDRHEPSEKVFLKGVANDFYLLTEHFANWNTSSTTEADHINMAKLRAFMDKHFNESELKNICFDLQVDYENLEGPTKADKVRELIAHFDRRGRLNDLVLVCRQQRSHIDLAELFQ